MSEISKYISPCLSEAIDITRQLVALRDPYTANHENCVGNFARAIAVEMGLDQTIQEQLLLAGYLHDIGKIIVPVSILTKPGKLSPEEFNLIKNHVQAGFDLLKTVSLPLDVSRAVLEHHERLDGSGYPNHLKADQISILSRILSVSDVVLSMAAARPYRSAMGAEAALAEIERGSDAIYDRVVVDACCKLMRSKDFQLSAYVNRD